ncbi:MAG: AAA family ATPase [Candidatus Devosia phytovorans]|uniref:AAA family ATPase n=1 Tax=Candidatus Devosia phytovorans TaxID=3121372 RepID=A0AAJ5VXH6_9HYPH|nr:AAA family ATPase [Devosia sp.]WEK05866.1 MAG: AAA family ATPase [Devosia sp.]
MPPIPPLADFGCRIMINGPSNAGKSTLADAIARKLDIPPVHLDRFSHEEHGNWIPRSEEAFQALHDAAIRDDAWVMDGNYSRLMAQRYARATGIVVIDDHLLRRYRRYFYRSLFQQRRLGGLASGQDGVKWEMIRWIWKTRHQGKYEQVARQTGLPVVTCRNQAELQQLYGAWGLDRR